MSKRIKINFDTVNEGKYEIIPPEQIAQSIKNIREGMKEVFRKNPHYRNLNRFY